MAPQSTRRERAFLFGVVLRVTSSKRRRLARYEFEADMDLRAAPGSRLDAANERVLALESFNQVLEQLDRDLALGIPWRPRLARAA